MQKLLAWVALLMLVTTTTWANTSTGLTCKRLVATGNPEYPPYLFRESDDNNRLIGANTEILRMIGQELNVEIDVVYTGPWSRAQKEVREGRIDLIAGAFFTVPRAQYMDYVYPAFLTTRSVVWVNKERPFEYQAKEDLIGRKGITVIHNSFGEEFDTFAKERLNITTVPSLEQAFKVMSLGRVDYLLYENSPAQAYARDWGIAADNHAIGPAISSEGLYLTLSHLSRCNDGALRGQLTRAIRNIIEQGKAEEALQAGMALWKNR